MCEVKDPGDPTLLSSTGKPNKITEVVHSADQFCNPDSNKSVALLWILGYLCPIYFVWEEGLQKTLSGIMVDIDVL